MAEVIEAANDTSYGLGCNIFSENTSRALRVAHQLEAGSAWVRTYRNWFGLKKRIGTNSFAHVLL